MPEAFNVSEISELVKQRDSRLSDEQALAVGLAYNATMLQSDDGKNYSLVDYIQYTERRLIELSKRINAQSSNDETQNGVSCRQTQETESTTD